MKQTIKEQKAASLVVLDSANHWKRSPATNIERNKQKETKNLFEIYPNPSEENLRVSIQNQEAMKGELSLCHISGKCEVEQKVTQQHFQIDISHLPTGYYTVSYKKGDEMAVKKLLIH